MAAEKITGIKAIFNNHTITGRANVAKATLASLLAFTIYYKFLRVKMAGEELKGMNKIFNGSTLTGRANVAKATYASVGLLIMYFTLKPKSKK